MAPPGWRSSSRRTTMRCLGVSVSSRLGQTGSQKPHSMHMSASGSIEGSDLRWSRCAFGPLGTMTPGFSSPCGSTRAFSRRMMAIASGPHSVSTNGAMFRPVPCSALSAPSYFRTTSGTSASMKRAYWSTAA